MASIVDKITRAPGTFKKKDVKTSAEKNRQLQKLAEKSLGASNLRKSVMLPPGEDLDEWLAYNLLDGFNKIQILYEEFSEFCTKESCPVMNAGSKYEYKWADGVKIKKPIECSAPEYIDYLMSWVQEQLEDEKLFPQEPDVPFPKNFRTVVKDIYRRLFRVYAHLYLSHPHHIEQEQFTAHLNTCGRHFVFFVQEFDLIDKKQLEPLSSVISEWDSKYPREAANDTDTE